MPHSRNRNRVLSRREQARLLRAAPRDFRAFCLACRESGARPQEVRVLAWADLRSEHSPRSLAAALLRGEAYFYLAEHKQRGRMDEGGPRVIPITPRLGRLLVRLARRGPQDGEIFRRITGQPWSKCALCRRMAKLREKCSWARKCFGENVVLYTWRHTRATAWAAAGLNLLVLSYALGHRSAKTTQRYVHMTPAMLRHALGQLGG